MLTHENMKRDVSLLSPIWGGYWMAHIAFPWDVHILSLSQMAQRSSQERRHPIVISRRDNDTLRIALTSRNMCVHGPRASAKWATRPGPRSDNRHWICDAWHARHGRNSKIGRWAWVSDVEGQ